ncbi:MAG: hypothetical protein IJF31_01260 [Clostridia bacterium]|nr:hypothetical protein [Clostridia bacterium]
MCLDASLLYAVTDKGKQLPFAVQKLGGGYLLTLKREMLQGVKQLRALPALSAANAGDEGYWLLPRNISMSGDILTRFLPREDLVYTYSRPIMSCYGIKKTETCCLVRVERNYYYQFEAEVKEGVYTLSVLFDFTDRDRPYDDIRIEILPLALDADYNDMARAEREVRLARDEIVTLAEKCRRPAVEYARKYPVVRIRMGWKPSPSPVLHQTEATEPDMHVACDFARVRDIADEMKRRGVAGAELQLVGWNRSGHDGRYPQMLPADPRLGGDDEMKKTIAYVKALGYRISTHTNFIDAYPIGDTFTWDDVAKDREGNYIQIGHYSAGLAYHVCPIRQLKNARRDLPPVADMGENGLHYTDVVSIVIPDVCHDPAHPSNTANGILYAQKMVEYERGLFGGFSSEGAMDFAHKHLDFILYNTFGDGFAVASIPIADRLLPFFEITYHGTLLYNPTSPTVNYTLKAPRERLMLYMRGGRPAMYYYSKFRTGGAKNWMGECDLVCGDEAELTESVARIKQAADEYARLADLQLCFMLRYDYLDNGLEMATYENGTRIVGNFTDQPLSFEGCEVAAMDYAVLL